MSQRCHQLPHSGLKDYKIWRFFKTKTSNILVWNESCHNRHLWEYYRACGMRLFFFKTMMKHNGWWGLPCHAGCVPPGLGSASWQLIWDCLTLKQCVMLGCKLCWTQLSLALWWALHSKHDHFIVEHLAEICRDIQVNHVWRVEFIELNYIWILYCIKMKEILHKVQIKPPKVKN